MKRHIFSFFSVMAALFALTACSDDILLSLENSTVFTPKGTPVDAYLDLSVSSLSVSSSTRDAVDEVMDDNADEREIDNVWVFQYDALSKTLIAVPQYVTIESNDQEELTHVPVRLSDNDGDNSIIYVVTNTAYNAWVQYNSGTQGYDGFMTIDDIEKTAIPTPKPQRLKYNYNTSNYDTYEGDGSLSIPMAGYSDNVTITDGTTVTVNVQRMFAKLRMRIDLSDFESEDFKEPSVYDVSVGNIPEYCRVTTLLDENDESQAGDYSDCKSWLTRAFTNNENVDDTEDGIIYPYVIYIPENVQGENGNSETTENKSDNLPDAYALSVTVSIHAITNDENGATKGPFSFTVYPGANETTDFNVKRNCVYDLTVKINDIVDAMVESANCIVCLSGQTTSFYPYYRTEEGGGYEFIDYLNYVYGETSDGLEENEDKRIDNVGLIWQSESQNTSNTGYIGNTEDNKLVWIDDAPGGALDDAAKTYAEYRRQIYVTIPEGEIGNALIGAYNSSGDLIWSWHIWSRAAAEDPSNEGNGVLYYTYDWNNNGILTSSPRVQGYTVMNCNLGALANTPTTSDGIETFGTLYQWGRKDPFPAIRTIGSAPANYNSTIVGTYYDKTGSTQVGMTEKKYTEAGEGNKLFYSLAGDDRSDSIGTAFGDYISYSILHPTVFICATKDAGQVTENYASTLSNYSEPRDGNWMSDSSGDHYNHIWGGLDPEQGDNVSRVFDTGYVDKESNPIHLYDDYGDDKSIFDPCPYGWRVSPPDLWLGFTKTGLNPTNSIAEDVNYQSYTSNGFYMYMDGGKWTDTNLTTSFFPCQGTRVADGSSYRVGTCGNYHNATADGARVNILHLHNSLSLFKIFEFNLLQYYVKAVGGPVRCVRYKSVTSSAN